MSSERPSVPFDASDPERVWAPRVTVATVVERDGRFLFVEETIRGERVLNQPAGHLDPDESLIDAAVRETREESGWIVRPTGLIAVYHWRGPETGSELLRFTFAAEAVSEIADAALDDGIERIWWLSQAELESHRLPPRSPLVHRSIDDFRARAPAPLALLATLKPTQR